MTDKEFIIWLCELLWEDLSDGDVPDDADFDLIRKELQARDIDIGEVFTY
jgi:hypothetical protein